MSSLPVGLIQGQLSAEAPSAIILIGIQIIGLSAFTTTTLGVQDPLMETLLVKQKSREGRQAGGRCGFSCKRWLMLSGGKER